MKLVKGNYTRLTDLSREDVDTVYKMYCGSGFPICTDDYDTDIRYVTYVGIDGLDEVSLWDDETSYGEDREYVPVCDLNQSKANEVSARSWTDNNCSDAKDGVVTTSEAKHSIDNVNEPTHYKLFPDMQAIDIIRRALTSEEYRGYCKGNALKYRLRAGLKDEGKTLEDIAKSEWYRAEAFSSGLRE